MENVQETVNPGVQQVYMSHCLECGMMFAMTESEVKWYMERDYMLPKRCKACREKRKVAAAEKDAE